jgi:MoxR-like ATPase
MAATGVRPYYVPVGNEELVFKAAFRQGLSIVLKGPTGCGKTPFVTRSNSTARQACGATSFSESLAKTTPTWAAWRQQCTPYGSSGQRWQEC